MSSTRRGCRCPDCNRAVPAVIEACEARGVYLLEVSVGDAESYKSPDFPLRHAPRPPCRALMQPTVTSQLGWGCPRACHVA